jgi:hypothetical protein
MIISLCTMQIVLNTDANAGDLRHNLNYIYCLYVEFVMKNPLYTPGQPFRYVCDDLLTGTYASFVRIMCSKILRTYAEDHVCKQ